ncbi:MAG: HIT domain-containing protein [Tepidisphaeraceae bacterium]|jgi:ATP adenylyltransferase
MEQPTLHAPWRMEYIRSLGQQDQSDCFLCQAAAVGSDPAARRDHLLLWDTELTIVVLNRFPYANGHLLIAPRLHKGEMEDLTDAENSDVARQTVAAMRLLRRAISAQGFNVGINIGRVAGAGLPGHLHQHLVPRWGGDINFMSIIGETRVIPQAIPQLYDELLKVHTETLP